MNSLTSMKRTRHAKRPFLLLVVLLITGVGVPGLSISPAFALPKDPIDPPPIDDTFIPPAQGFDWRMVSRFGRDDDGDGLIDYHWDGNMYDPAYVHPTQLLVAFYACPSQAEEDASSTQTTQNTYTWEGCPSWMGSPPVAAHLPVHLPFSCAGHVLCDVPCKANDYHS